MCFRIGVNVGAGMVKDGDIFGDGVNVAARLDGLVKRGEICVSRGVHHHLRHRGGMVFEDLGEADGPASALRRSKRCAPERSSDNGRGAVSAPHLPGNTGRR